MHYVIVEIELEQRLVQLPQERLQQNGGNVIAFLAFELRLQIDAFAFVEALLYSLDHQRVGRFPEQAFGDESILIVQIVDAGTND